MSENLPALTKRAQTYYDWVVNNSLSVAQELSEAGMPLTDEGINAFQIYRAQCIVDRAAQILVRKQSDESEQQLSDELWLADYFNDTLPNDSDDWLGLEHVRFMVTELGYAQERYAITIFDALIRMHDREMSDRARSYHSNPPKLNAKYRFQEDDPTQARVLKENRLAVIPRKAIFESRTQRRYNGAYLFKCGDVLDLLGSGQFYAGGQKTKGVYMAIGAWLHKRVGAASE
jgi:hypothetical protein